MRVKASCLFTLVGLHLGQWPKTRIVKRRQRLRCNGSLSHIRSLSSLQTDACNAGISIGEAAIYYVCSQSHRINSRIRMGCVVLNRPWILGVLAGVAAWAIVRKEAAALVVVKADVAAELLRQAWDKNHTTA